MSTIDFDIRNACGDDIPFIYATWLESYRYDSYFGKSHRNTIFFHEYRTVLDRILETARTIIACVKDEPNAILGYLVYEKDILHYAFTKSPFRRLGIQNKLVEHAFLDGPIYFTHKTYTAVPIVEQAHRFIFRGTALLKTTTQLETTISGEQEIHGKTG